MTEISPNTVTASGHTTQLIKVKNQSAGYNSTVGAGEFVDYSHALLISLPKNSV